MLVCDCNYIDGWKEQASQQNMAEWAAEDVASHLKSLETARYGFPVTDSYKNKVAMLSARMQRIVEEIAELNAEGDNV
jgi:hypothetical protein